MTSPPTVEVTTPGAREVRVRRAFAAPRALVFECWTKPDLLRRWLLGPPGWEMTGCDVDLRVGGAYRYVWRHENGELLELNGSFREIVPPSRIVSTETFGDDWTAGATVVRKDRRMRNSAEYGVRNRRASCRGCHNFADSLRSIEAHRRRLGKSP